MDIAPATRSHSAKNAMKEHQQKSRKGEPMRLLALQKAD
jgi:hypothetical protein